MKIITVYDIWAFDVHIYCKVTEINKGGDNYSCEMAFGSGNKKFCLTAIYRVIAPHKIYIDRVDHDSKCVIDGSLDDFSEGTIKVVKSALWFMKQKFENVKIFTLHDDSQIYCEKGSKLYKLSLSYDYIIKYNKTWYQTKFKAQLPGYLSEGKVIDGSVMDIFNRSLNILDTQLLDFEIIKEKFTAIESYEDEYKLSNTPRQFIQLLRKKYGSNYCFKVGKWLNSYMLYLEIDIFAQQWYIKIENIIMPENYVEIKHDNMASSRIFYGGKRKTRKHANYRLAADRFSTDGYCVGYYEDFE